MEVKKQLSTKRVFESDRRTSYGGAMTAMKNICGREMEKCNIRISLHQGSAFSLTCIGCTL